MAQTDKGFDAEAFYKALAVTVAARGISWKKVAQDTGVSATTLTRMAQGRKPDAASFAVLAAWGGLDVKDFVNVEAASAPESLAMATHFLRGDPHLNESQKSALEAMLTSAYRTMRGADEK